MFSITKLLVFLSIFFVVTIAAPHQELPPRPGYVPVYIREGNTPLSQINPKLVEAFKEDGESNSIQREPTTTNEAKIANSETLKKDKEDENDQNKQDNDNVGTTEEQERAHKEAKQPVQETPASDIAEFTSDDIKTLIKQIIKQ